VKTESPQVKKPWVVSCQVGRNNAAPLQVCCVKRLREEFAHLQDFGFAFEVGQDHRNVPAKFPDELAASAAGWSEGVGISDDGDGVKAALAFADGFKYGGAFGADGQAVGGVFDVAATEDTAGRGTKCGAYTEVGVGSVSVFAGLFGDGNEIVVVGQEVDLPGIPVSLRQNQLKFRRA
jgi:hypothetical protein